MKKRFTPYKKFTGFSLPELTIALSILLLSVVALGGLGTSYLSILNSYRQRFLALNMAQEGLELAIALRNKQIEQMDSSNWLGVTTAGSYCLQFNTSTNPFSVSRQNPCYVFPGYKRLVSYSDFQNSSNNNLTTATSVKVISEVQFGNNDKISLDIILTKWHPNQ